MDKKQEKERKERIKKLVRETEEERYKRVTSGNEPKSHVIPNKKRNNKPKHKNKEEFDR